MELHDQIKKRAPVRLLRAYRGFRGYWSKDDPPFGPHTGLGDMGRDFQRIKNITGYCTYEESVAFRLILATQSNLGCTGDILEIGCYFGRSAVPLASSLRPGERLLLCDAFDMAEHGAYPVPSVKAVWDNLLTAIPGLDSSRIDIIKAFSTNLDLGNRLFRFIHVDGGHSYAEAQVDLGLAVDHLAPGGVIAVDDYHHASWPEITPAVDDFLAKHPSMAKMADMNRSTMGRKLFLTYNG